MQKLFYVCWPTYDDSIGEAVLQADSLAGAQAIAQDEVDALREERDWPLYVTELDAAKGFYVLTTGDVDKDLRENRAVFRALFQKELEKREA